MRGAPANRRLEKLLADPVLSNLMDALNPPGEETRLVGGIVRNTLLGEPTDDVDLCTTLLPPGIVERGKAAGWKAIPTGIEHGTITLLREGRSFEVTTLRRDVETNGRHARVLFGRDFEEDAARRDFTINALSLGKDGRLHDYFGGEADLAARIVRFIGDPETRLREDYLRGLRFFRFSARYGGGRLDPAGMAAILRMRPGFAGLSRERVRHELFKLIMAAEVLPVLRQLDEVGLLPDLLGTAVDLDRFAARAALQSRFPGLAWPALARFAALLPRKMLTDPALQDAYRLSNEEMRWLEQCAGAEDLLARGSMHLASWLAEDFPLAAGEAIALAASVAPEPEPVLALAEAVDRHPRLQISGRDFLAAGFTPGPMVGTRLAAFRAAWIEAGAPASESEQRALFSRFLAEAGAG
ncbi:MAG: CCA tRNA nucleotidyltransferase [Beijerinckiaceae bacterium]|nr:CCA tRNA nucleotidyltransferase [Beijerinckiaceae bacterium]MCZ8301038.1 CCA tRNA nucleotidyltransferase [Beijerinckiaceae bacterium]